MMITFTVPWDNGKKVLTMDEYISREETIKRIKECYCTGCNSYNGVALYMRSVRRYGYC